GPPGSGGGTDTGSGRLPPASSVAYVRDDGWVGVAPPKGKRLGPGRFGV
ncbi:MAG: hypothetical protein AVDCRST_MAG33-3461, partial [uncultured Thermomicrobiales bacterium]